MKAHKNLLLLKYYLMLAWLLPVSLGWAQKPDTARQIKYGIHIDLNEAKAKIRTQYSSPLTHWGTEQKAIFESRGIGAYIAFPIQSHHFFGFKLSGHQFAFYGTNVPFFKKHYFGQSEVIFKSRKHSARYSDVFEISAGCIYAAQMPFNKYFINYSSPYQAKVRVGGATFNFKWGLQMPLIDDKLICVFGFHTGYRSIRIKKLELDGPYLKHDEFNFDYRAYQIGLFFQIENWLPTIKSKNLNEQ